MDSKELINDLINISKNAGNAILEIYNSNTENFGIDYKDDNSPLTKADKASDRIIYDGLKNIDNTIPILSEEGKNIKYNTRKKWGKFWLVDPLDGTKEFIKKNGEFTVNIALIKDGEPILGVVYAPVLETIWYGSIDTGSFIIEANKTKKISVLSSNNDLPIKIVSSRSHSNNIKLEKFLEKIEKYELIKMGSSIKICLVADGRAHLYPRFGPTMEWDTAAAHAVVKFAGGKIINLDNKKELSYNKEKLLNPEFMVQYN